MKFFRKKDKKKEGDYGAYGSFLGGGKGGDGYGPGAGLSRRMGPLDYPTAASARLLAYFGPPILSRIFAFVCPHTQDESYETCEESAMEDACMLCDLRDLAHAGMTQKSWRAVAIRLQYHSIRIDQVHYCEREDYLAERRKRRSRFDKNGDPEDTAHARLKLLCRTLRDDPTRLGPIVRYLRTPYMLRESATADLARTIAVLPNLVYVDLPEGMFADEGGYTTLRLEVQARCPDLRKMTYVGGSERSLELLARGNIWTRLEVLELTRINMDPAALRVVLGALPKLRALKVKESEAFADDVFNPAENGLLPPFPALAEFVLDSVPRVTAYGLATFLSRRDAKLALRVLTLTSTGVETAALHDAVARAPNLKHLSVRAEVSAPFPATANPPLPPLSSRSLQTLHYEISSSPQTSPYSNAAGTHYGYLAASILAGGLPNLRAVYVLDADFADTLLGLPPLPPLQNPGGPGGLLGVAPHLSGRPGSSSNAYRGSSAAGYGGGPAAPRPTSSALLMPQYHVAAAANRFSSNNPFAAGGGGGAVNPQAGSPIGNHQLEVFTRSDDEIGWSFVRVPASHWPNAHARSGSNGGAYGGQGGHHQQQQQQHHSRHYSHQRGQSVDLAGPAGLPAASARPVSSYGLASDVNGLGWGQANASRKSVMIGNGAGGFLAVPGPGDYGGVPPVPSLSGSLGGGGGGGGGLMVPGQGAGRRGYGAGGGYSTSPRNNEESADLWPRPKSSSGEKRSNWMG